MSAWFRANQLTSTSGSPIAGQKARTLPFLGPAPRVRRMNAYIVLYCIPVTGIVQRHLCFAPTLNYIQYTMMDYGHWDDDNESPKEAKCRAIVWKEHGAWAAML